MFTTTHIVCVNITDYMNQKYYSIERTSEVRYYKEKMHCIVYYRLQFDIIIYFIPIYILQLLLASLSLGGVQGFVGRSLLSLWV